MSLFSGISGFHTAQDGPSEINTEQFGLPVRSLYTELDPGDMHQQISVMDEQGNTLYRTRSSVFVLTGKTDVFDADGTLVAHLEKKPISLHEKHYITMADGRRFTLSNELFHIVKDITNIEGLDWQIRGNIVGLNFVLFDQNSAPIAAIGQKLISMHDRYSIDLYQPQHEKIVVAIVIQLQKMLNARRESNR